MGGLDIDVEDADIETNGVNAYAIHALHTGVGLLSVGVTGGSIGTNGDHASAVYGRRRSGAGRHDLDILAEGAAIVTRGIGSHGALAYFFSGAGDIGIDIRGGSIETQGESAAGVFGWHDRTGAVRIEARNADIETAGKQAYGILGRHRGSGGVTVGASGGAVATTGAGAHGIYGLLTPCIWHPDCDPPSRGNIVAGVTGKATVTTQGAGAHGMYAGHESGEGSIALTVGAGSTVSASGAGRAVSVSAGSTLRGTLWSAWRRTRTETATSTRASRWPDRWRAVRTTRRECISPAGARWSSGRTRACGQRRARRFTRSARHSPSSAPLHVELNLDGRSIAEVFGDDYIMNDGGVTTIVLNGTTLHDGSGSTGDSVRNGRWNVSVSSSQTIEDRDFSEADFIEIGAPLAPPAPSIAEPGAVAGDGSATFYWTSGGDRGSVITKWQYVKRAGDGEFETDWTDICVTATEPDCPDRTSHTVTGLTNGTAYKFKVRAVNALGPGAASGPTNAVAPAAKPSAPSKPVATAGDGSVALSWTPGSDGGSAVTKWQYVKQAGDGVFETVWRDVPDSGASTRRHTVTGLTNGVAYRFKVRAVNVMGGGTESPESDAVTPTWSPPGMRGWLARFGRAAGAQAVEMISGRMNAPAPVGAKMTLGGRRVDLNDDMERLLANEGAGFARNAGGSGRLALGGDESTGTYRKTTVSDLLRGGSFHLASAKGAEDAPGGRWSMWGRGARTSFEGAGALEGNVATAMLGVDYEKEHFLMGVALSRAKGEGGFGNADRSEVEATLTSVHPYLRYRASERLSVWGVLGFGQGEMTLEEKARRAGTDIQMRMGAFGVRGELMRVGGFDLALKSDALLAQVDADEKNGLEAVSTEATRLRVMLEASREVSMKGGGRFTPSVEAGLRHDGGDADEGMGVEVGGRLRFTSPSMGLTFEVNARGLLTHEEKDVADWGVGGMLRIAPGGSGKGLALTVRPEVGETAGGTARLWGLKGASRLAKEETGGMDPRVRAEVGYGLDAWGGLLTPYAGLSVSEGGSGVYRLGGRFRIGERLRMSVEGDVREREADGPVHGVALRGSLRW